MVYQVSTKQMTEIELIHIAKTAANALRIQSIKDAPLVVDLCARILKDQVTKEQIEFACNQMLQSYRFERNAGTVVQKVRLYNDTDLVHLVDVKMWDTPRGEAYQDEHLARLRSSTHTICLKNAAHGLHESSSYCESCARESEVAAWKSMKRVSISDAKWPLMAYDTNEFFEDEEALHDHVRDNELDPKELMLVEGKPNRPRYLDIDYFENVLPDETDHLPKALQEAVDAFNQAIEGMSPLSYSLSKVAVDLDESFIASLKES